MNTRVELTDGDRKEMKWWLLHHKGSVQYLAKRIKKLVENPDDEEYREFFYNHFSVTIDDFLKGVEWDNSNKGE